MVASSKLHRAQQAIEQMRPYETRLNKIMASFVANLEGEVTSPYAVKREVHKVAIVAFTSNSSLCGGFNGNVIKRLRQVVADYRRDGVEIVRIYPIGKKAADAVRKLGFANLPEYSSLLDHPEYAPASDIAAELMRMFALGAVDKVEMIYHHFKSSATQVLRQETFLPVELPVPQESGSDMALDYIVEPSPEALVLQLIPKALHLKVFTALLDSIASEHAARVIAMQVATDNADDLLRELTLMYNKTRQQAITAELLDIVGGSVQ